MQESQGVAETGEERRKGKRKGMENKGKGREYVH